MGHREGTVILRLWLASVVLTVVYTALVYHLGRTHERNQRIANYQHTTDTLRVAYAKLDTVYLRRVMYRDSIMTEWDTVRLRDTLVRNDTVYVPRDRADSAIAACSAVTETCEQQKANLTARLAIADSMLAIPPKPVGQYTLIAFTLGVLTTFLKR